MKKMMVILISSIAIAALLVSCAGQEPAPSSQSNSSQPTTSQSANTTQELTLKQEYDEFTSSVWYTGFISNYKEYISSAVEKLEATDASWFEQIANNLDAYVGTIPAYKGNNELIAKMYESLNACSQDLKESAVMNARYCEEMTRGNENEANKYLEAASSLVKNSQEQFKATDAVLLEIANEAVSNSSKQ